jgi:hypothetical protein
MPNDAWYAISLKSGVAEGFCRSLDLIRDQDAALVFSDSCPEGRALLVSITSIVEHQVHVQTQATVSINSLVPIANVILQGLDRCVKNIHDTVVAEAGTKGVSVDAIWENANMLPKLLKETALELFEHTPELKQACYFDMLSRMTSATEEELLQRFLEYVDEHSHCGGIIGIPYPDDQLWCVD